MVESLQPLTIAKSSPKGLSWDEGVIAVEGGSVGVNRGCMGDGSGRIATLDYREK